MRFPREACKPFLTHPDRSHSLLDDPLGDPGSALRHRLDEIDAAGQMAHVERGMMVTGGDAPQQFSAGRVQTHRGEQAAGHDVHHVGDHCGRDHDARVAKEEDEVNLASIAEVQPIDAEKTSCESMRSSSPGSAVHAPTNCLSHPFLQTKKEIMATGSKSSMFEK